MPNVGILEPGASTTVSITGNLNATISGPTSAQFKAESLQSGKFALAMVNTTFYYCEEVMKFVRFRSFFLFFFVYINVWARWFDRTDQFRNLGE